MCRPYLGCCVRLAGLVLLLSPVFACLSSCLPAWLGCCVRPLGLSPSPACLRSCLPSGLPACMGCRVRALGLSPKFHVRFEQLFGVFGGLSKPVLTSHAGSQSHLSMISMNTFIACPLFHRCANKDMQQQGKGTQPHAN